MALINIPASEAGSDNLSLNYFLEECMKKLTGLFLLLLLSNVIFAKSIPLQTYYHYYAPSLIKTSQMKTEFPGNGAPAATLGFGYSTDRDTPTVMCIDPGTTTYGGSGRGLVDVAKNYSLREIKKFLHISTDIDINVGLFSDDITADFVHQSEDDQYSESFMYRTAIELRNSIYNPPATGDVLNRVGQAFQKDPDAFRKYCGDKYVSQIYWGGQLYLGVKMQFHNSDDRQTFDTEMKGSYADIFSMDAKLSEAVSKVNKEGAISIYAFQLGGDPTKLGKILGGGGGKAPITQCSFDNLQKCQDMLNALITYATSTEGDNFPTQIKIGGPDVPVSAAQLGPDLLEYAYLGVPISASSKLTPEIKQARLHLADELSQTTTDIHRTQFLIGTSSYPPYTQKLQGVLDNLQYNNALIDNAGQTCFTDLDNCLATQQQTDLNLKPIDHDLLKGPEKKIYQQVTFPIDWNHTGDTFDFDFAVSDLDPSVKSAKIIAIDNMKMAYSRALDAQKRSSTSTAFMAVSELPINSGAVPVTQGKTTLHFNFTANPSWVENFKCASVGCVPGVAWLELTPNSIFLKGDVVVELYRDSSAAKIKK
jgi:hypothetical protein